VAFEHGLVVGKFAPLHKGHQFLLETALNDCARVTVLVYSNPDFPGMPSETRASWLRTLYPRLEVFVPENPPPNDASDLEHREFVKSWLTARGVRVDAVFTSESYGEGFAAHLGVPHRLVDLERHRIPISGTRVREDVHAAREFLEPSVYAHFVQKVVFLGAESTGKTTLTERMALECDTRFVAEFGREVWVQKNGQLELSDYVDIAHRHRELEDAALLESKRFLFVDTNAITTMFLGYAYEGEGAPELTALARDAQTRYHHVFLCDTDIPFEQDGWRDNDFWRRRAQGLIRYDLEVRGVPYTLVSGRLEERVAQVKAVLERSYT
jgi:HTH-type transcriptional regulator, transcriptional repressor of NAD biosynthesis genes